MRRDPSYDRARWERIAFSGCGPSCITSRLGELGVRVSKEYSRADRNVLMRSDVALPLPCQFNES